MPVDAKCTIAGRDERSVNTPDVESLLREVAAAHLELAGLRRERDDLEIELTTAVEHGDAIEAQLAESNNQLMKEVAVRRLAEERLQQLLDIISRQKDDLEVLVQTITEHSDQLDYAWMERFASIEHQAKTDSLTGIANRCHFDAYLKEVWQQAAAEGRPLGLLLCDVDYFKQYNDHYGHPAGDECLRRIAGALAAVVQHTGDLPVRYGGEEFAMVLPNATLDDALAVAERFQETVRRQQLPHPWSEVSPFVTLSVGAVSWIPEAERSPLDLLNAADQLLYLAKQRGRNRIAH